MIFLNKVPLHNYLIYHSVHTCTILKKYFLFFFYFSADMNYPLSPENHWSFISKICFILFKTISGHLIGKGTSMTMLTRLNLPVANKSINLQLNMLETWLCLQNFQRALKKKYWCNTSIALDVKWPNGIFMRSKLKHIFHYFSKKQRVLNSTGWLTSD